ncbi:short-chain dehydrogenase/reductase-family protein [Octadecabacter antarcticus 307]|uniref:Short-chain dehydrogenase/reductase-family protein n=1 Tax=Octadecabacter antarcticus 307 TaxID=391626 RepID=M9RFR4_9RHOB|nr:SDR family oxidoreductase [Octadecabacter antarcticus]AGI68665.1 short-chain dehydrogenase/reductase-family protein [Octadecabacter antarcticus 307]
MTEQFKDKTVVVTGAGVGIGLEIARRLVAQGACVMSADITVTPELTKLTEESGGFALELDLGSRDGPPALIEAAVERSGQLDVLINNLGASPVRTSFLTTTDDDWARLFEINFFSMVRATRSAMPHLIKTKGAVVSIASILAREPIIIQPDYCATKAAILSLTKTISKEFGPDGVRAVCVSPGPTLTPQWTDPGGQIEQYAERAGVSPEEALRDTIPRDLDLDLRRFIRPSEIADAVLFAAGPHASAITGTEILVDAGMRGAI